jgi:hypothetical protein
MYPRGSRFIEYRQKWYVNIVPYLFLVEKIPDPNDFAV